MTLQSGTGARQASWAFLTIGVEFFTAQKWFKEAMRKNLAKLEKRR